MSTIEEIARIAGVSASTVSRALANNKKISEKTIKRIEKIANELNYTPNLSARALTGKGTKLIGLIVPEITSNFYVQIVNRVESELNAKGYALIIGTTDFNADKGIRNLEVFIGRAVDGIIFADEAVFDEGQAAAIRDRIKTPIIFLGLAGENTGHECITVDDGHGISLLVRHLVELGHKSFGFIGEKLSKQVRLPPFQKALAEWGLEYNEKFIKTDGSERFEAGGYVRMKELLAEGEMPTAVFATYDNIAIGAMKALHEAGLKVPEDVSIIGFDNIKESEYLIPALTTVFPPITEMARRAVDMLIEKIEKKDSDGASRSYSAAKTILYPELVIRHYDEGDVNMSKKLKIGILGGGGILNAHAPGFTRLYDICEVVVAETNPDRHAHIRKLLGEEVEIVGDYRELLDREDIDAVDIILPHNLHAPAAIAAAKAGKPVLTEKVMARNVYECDQMIEACAQAGVSLTVCHDRRYDKDWQALKKVVDSGDLGEILFWKLEHNQNVVFPEKSWVRYRENLGGGAIMSCLTHQIDSLRWYGGEIESVTSMSKVEPSRMEGESIGAIIARMQSGALALLSINWYTQSHQAPDGLWYEFNHVTGTKGEAYFMSGKGTYVKIHDNQSKLFEYDMKGEGRFVKMETDNTITGHQQCIEEWVKSLRGEHAEIVTDGTDSRKTVEVAEAAYRSEATGMVVNIPIEPKPWQ